MRRALFLLPLLLLALGQGLPQVKELEERDLYWFLVNRVREIRVVGVPPKALGEALRGKRLTLVLGTEALPEWAKEARVYRLGGGALSGWFLLADARFFIGHKGKGYVLVESPELVAVVWGYLGSALGTWR